MKMIYMDESGHHNLDPKTIDPHYPIFVLCGCIFEETYYQKKVAPQFNQLKTDFFGSEDIILHTLEMTRPSKYKENRFAKLIDASFRNEFYRALNIFLAKIEFNLTACIIKKPAHLEKYGLEALDPYLLSFNTLLDAFIKTLEEDEKGKIIAERRNNLLDNQLEFAWLNLKMNGIDDIKGSEIHRKIETLSLVSKSANEAGLQIADLIANPVGRHVLGIKKTQPGHEIDYTILEKKLQGTKLTILPK